VTDPAFFAEARRSFHAALLGDILVLERKKVKNVGLLDVWSNADKDQATSRNIAAGIASRLGEEVRGARLAAQISGNKFEEVCRKFLAETWPKLSHMRPAAWSIERTGSLTIADYDQYGHLEELERLAMSDAQLAAALGSGYLVKPDVVIAREPEDDADINRRHNIVDESVSRLTSLRKINNEQPILHAVVSCKWTIRSDRAQNARSEALNLVRNRKGRLPHIVAITGEPTPSRISSLALGTGDIDCVYHFALPELRETVRELGYGDAAHLLSMMVEGKRLRDIADLPLDLAV
jgi:hypothetical protein